jgi:hypothetical protein
MLKLREKKREGDEMSPGNMNRWYPVFSELGSRVRRFDLIWGKYRRPLKKRKRVVQARAGDKPRPVYANGCRSHHGVSSPRRTRAPANSRCLQSSGKKNKKVKAR